MVWPAKTEAWSPRVQGTRAPRPVSGTANEWGVRVVGRQKPTRRRDGRLRDADAVAACRLDLCPGHRADPFFPRIGRKAVDVESAHLGGSFDRQARDCPRVERTLTPSTSGVPSAERRCTSTKVLRQGGTEPRRTVSNSGCGEDGSRCGACCHHSGPTAVSRALLWLPRGLRASRPKRGQTWPARASSRRSGGRVVASATRAASSIGRMAVDAHDDRRAVAGWRRVKARPLAFVA